MSDFARHLDIDEVQFLEWWNSPITQAITKELSERVVDTRLTTKICETIDKTAMCVARDEGERAGLLTFDDLVDEIRQKFHDSLQKSNDKLANSMEDRPTDAVRAARERALRHLQQSRGSKSGH